MARLVRGNVIFAGVLTALRIAEAVAGAGGRVLMELYEKFFATALKKDTERLGIVYTPVEIVDFILNSADHVLREEFGRSLSDEGVHVLDPFTGTGIFLVRLIQSALIAGPDLERKYRRELHANEIVLLAYDIAAVHIEEAFHGRQGANLGTRASRPLATCCGLSVAGLRPACGRDARVPRRRPFASGWDARDPRTRCSQRVGITKSKAGRRTILRRLLEGFTGKKRPARRPARRRRPAPASVRSRFRDDRRDTGPGAVNAFRPC